MPLKGFCLYFALLGLMQTTISVVVMIPQRSKTARISVSPQQFSGTARWIGGPLCVPCGYAVDEVPAKRIIDSIVPGPAG